MDWKDFLTIMVTIVTSASVIGLIEFFINRHDKKHDKQKEILERFDQLEVANKARFEQTNQKVDDVAAALEEQGARIARSNILRFEEELQSHKIHTKEYFRSVLDDIDNYDEYCGAHTGFKNSFTTEASAHIKSVYKKLNESGAFAPKEG